MTFNIGDRVRYFGPGALGDKTDFGTIVSRDNHHVGVWWVDWDNGERLFAQDIHLELIDDEQSEIAAEQSEIAAEQSEIAAEQSEISASISQKKLSVKQLKDLLNKMDDSIQLSFTDLKIHFG